MKIAGKSVVRASVQSWIGMVWDAKHFHGYIEDTETHKEHETQLEYFTYDDAMRGCVTLFLEFYNPTDYVLIFCSKAVLFTI